MKKDTTKTPPFEPVKPVLKNVIHTVASQLFPGQEFATAKAPKVMTCRFKGSQHSSDHNCTVYTFVYLNQPNHLQTKLVDFDVTVIDYTKK